MNRFRKTGTYIRPDIISEAIPDTAPSRTGAGIVVPEFNDYGDYG
jgi:hypothetical protein